MQGSYLGPLLLHPNESFRRLFRVLCYNNVFFLKLLLASQWSGNSVNKFIQIYRYILVMKIQTNRSASDEKASCNINKQHNPKQCVHQHRSTGCSEYYRARHRSAILLAQKEVTPVLRYIQQRNTNQSAHLYRCADWSDYIYQPKHFVNLIFFMDKIA